MTIVNVYKQLIKDFCTQFTFDPYLFEDFKFVTRNYLGTKIIKRLKLFSY